MSGGSRRTRAAVVTAPRSAAVVDVPLEDPPPGTVRVAVEGCGVCGSNLPVWEGRPWFDYPLPPGAPGHEAWGEIVDVGELRGRGSGGSRPAIGDRVGFLSDNAFADLVDVPAADVVPLPTSLTGPFPAEALGCAFNVAARAGFQPDQTVAVVGAGFLGCLVGALAAAAGAEVVALSRREFALETARIMGCKETVRVGDDALEQVSRLTGGGLVDVVVEAAGVQSTLDLAGQLTRVRGRLVIAAFHQDGPRSVDVQLWNWRGIDVVNAHERDPMVRVQGMREAAAAVAAGRLDPTPLYTHRYPLDRLTEAMNVMVERPDGFLKSLVLR